MLDQPWPPPAVGPQQPRDAHAGMWANDVRRAQRPARAGRGALDTTWWPDVVGGASVRRRRADAERDGEAGPWEPADQPREGGGAAERSGGPFTGARWMPQEGWIPQPTTSPEQRWTPERDWLTAFADRAADRADTRPGESVAAVGPVLRRWLVAAAVAVPVVVVLGLVVALA